MHLGQVRQDVFDLLLAEHVVRVPKLLEDRPNRHVNRCLEDLDEYFSQSVLLMSLLVNIVKLRAAFTQVPHE